jgi:cytoskeletal protein RodZ
MTEDSNQQMSQDTDQGTGKPAKEHEGGGSDTLGGQPQENPGEDQSNSILIVLLILIVFVIGFLLFAGDTAETPTEQPPQATTTEQPADTGDTATGTTNEADEPATSSDVEAEASATGSVDVN